MANTIERLLLLNEWRSRLPAIRLEVDRNMSKRAHNIFDPVEANLLKASKNPQLKERGMPTLRKRVANLYGKEVMESTILAYALDLTLQDSVLSLAESAKTKDNIFDFNLWFNVALGIYVPVHGILLYEGLIEQFKPTNELAAKVVEDVEEMSDEMPVSEKVDLYLFTRSFTEMVRDNMEKDPTGLEFMKHIVQDLELNPGRIFRYSNQLAAPFLAMGGRVALKVYKEFLG